MSHPIDDEDPTPRAAPGKKPPPPTAKPAGKPAAPAAKGVQPQPVAAPVMDAQEARLAWGHVGSVTKPGRLSDGTSRPGVIRVVEANIAYHVPPLDPYVWVSASLNYVGQYEMFWTEGDPFDVRSIGDLGAELRGGASKQNLKMLDNAADAILQTADRLHDHGGRLGLLHPGNVLVVPNSNGERVVLPDLGFVWRGSHGKFPWKDSPGRPRWLNEDPRENTYARLWDEEPVWKQFSTEDATGGHQELVPVQSDLRNLARVFASVLTGRIDRDLPSVPNPAPTWAVLRAVMKGEITTADQFRSRLAEHPLSEHWTAPKTPVGGPPQKSGAGLMLMGCLMFLLLSALGTGAGLYFAGVFDEETQPPGTGTEVAAATSAGAKPTSKAAPSTSRPVPRTTRAGVGSSAGEAGNLVAAAAINAVPKPMKRPLDKTEVDWRNKPSDIPREIADLIKQLENAKDPRQRFELLLKLYGFYETANDALRSRIRPSVEYWRGHYLADWEGRYKKADDAVIKNPALRFDVGQQIRGLHEEIIGLRQRYEPISPSLNAKETECLLISELRSRELGSP